MANIVSDPSESPIATSTIKFLSVDNRRNRLSTDDLILYCDARIAILFSIHFAKSKSDALCRSSKVVHNIVRAADFFSKKLNDR